MSIIIVLLTLNTQYQTADSQMSGCTCVNVSIFAVSATWRKLTRGQLPLL